VIPSGRHFLECGGSTPLSFCFRQGKKKERGVEPPHSKKQKKNGDKSPHSKRPHAGPFDGGPDAQWV